MENTQGLNYRARRPKAVLVMLAISFAGTARAQDAAELQKPDGWLALAGLEWLEPGDNSFGSAKDNKIHLPPTGPAHMGVLHLDGETIILNPPAGGFPTGFLIDGKPVQAQALHTDPDHDKNN